MKFSKISASTSAVLVSITVLVGCGNGGGSAEGFCSQLEETAAYFEKIDEVDSDEATADEAIAVYDGMAEEFTKLADSAPAEISQDVDLMADYIENMAEKMKSFVSDFGSDPNEHMDEFLAVMSDLSEGYDEAELAAAGDALTDYGVQECGLEEDFIS